MFEKTGYKITKWTDGIWNTAVSYRKRNGWWTKDEYKNVLLYSGPDYELADQAMKDHVKLEEPPRVVSIDTFNPNGSTYTEGW